MTNYENGTAQRPASYILIHTDGACSGNPGPGGCAAVLRRFEAGEQTKKAIIIDGKDWTTNIQMEMTAVIIALRKLRADEVLPVIVRTDSQLVVKGMTEWLPGWIRNGWLGSNKKPVSNQDLWKEILAETSLRNVIFEWVRGHDGDAYNEEVDGLATQEAQRRKKRLVRPSPAHLVRA